MSDKYILLGFDGVITSRRSYMAENQTYTVSNGSILFAW